MPTISMFFGILIKIIVEWIEQYTDELLEDWDLMEKGLPLKKIPGADQ